MSWWDFGEWSGHRGSELEIFNIPCPFCGEKGNFETVHHEEKQKPNGHKVLNFDTLKCGSCASFVLVFWSGGEQIHNFKVVPWPLTYDRYPEEWPDDVGRFWIQAKRNIKDTSWDAAAVMVRSALQLALREQGAEGSTLYAEIDDLAAKGLLPPIMKDWAHELRLLGNESAHPTPGTEGANSKDVHGAASFLDFLLRYLYTLPSDIKQYLKPKEKL